MEVKLVGVALAVHLGHYVLVVIVAKRTGHLIVVHVWLGLALSPLARDLIRVSEFELAASALPGNNVGISGVGEELQQELPQLNLAAALAHQSAGGVAKHGVRVYK